MKNPNKKERTTIAIDRKYRPALDLLAKVYHQESKDSFRYPTNEEVVVKAIVAALEAHGVNFLPGPADADLVPVVTKKRRA